MSVLRAVCEYKKAKSLSLKCGVFMSGVPGSSVVLYFHGGALISGNRNSFLGFQFNALNKAGFNVVTFDYRLAPETKLPLIIEDVRDAIIWAKSEGSRIFGIDPDRTLAMGSSAGGYLALMAGTFDVKPRAIISIYGYGDILGDWYSKPDGYYRQFELVSEEAARSKIGKRERVSGNRGEFYLYTRQNGIWPSAVSGFNIDTERDEIAKYCPINYVADGYPPTIFLHGDNDTDVPYQQSVDMYNTLKKHGVATELLTCKGGRHGFDADYKETTEPLRMFNQAIEFVTQYLK